MRPGTFAIVLAFASTLLAWGVNEHNLRCMRNEGVPLRGNETVITADDYSYLHPMETLMETGSLYKTRLEKYSSIIRSPAYGFTYRINAGLFGQGKALHMQKYQQLLLFGLSVWCFFQLCMMVLKRKRWAMLTAGLYALLPFSMGFLYYTLTEAITPALLIFFFYFLILGSEEHRPGRRMVFYVLAALVFSYLFLCRPVLGIFGLAFPVFIWKDYGRKPFRTLALIVLMGLISGGLQLSWQIRNYRLSGSYRGLHPVYQAEIPGKFRLPYTAAWDFFKGWESEGHRFHESAGLFWERSLSGRDPSGAIDSICETIPDKVRQHFGTARLRAVFKDYAFAIAEQRPWYEKDSVMPAEPLVSEIKAARGFELLSREHARVFPFERYLLTPLKVLKNMILHSNLSLHMFQHTYRGQWWMEALRWISLMVHALAYMLCWLFFFRRNHWGLRILLGICIPLYLSYMVFFQRGIEERYTLPLLAPVLLAAVSVIKDIFIGKMYAARKRTTSQRHKGI